MQRDMDFSDCLNSYKFADENVNSCDGLFINGLWFSYAHIEVGGGASCAVLHTDLKVWCTGASNSSSRLLQRCSNNVKIFIDLIQRGPRDKEARYLRFTVLRPGDLIYIRSSRPHDVLTIDTGKPTNLSGWDASTNIDSSFLIRTPDEYKIGLRRGTGPKALRTQGKDELQNWVFLITTALVLLGEALPTLAGHFDYLTTFFAAPLLILY